MTDYIKIFKLKEKFIKATTLTDLKEIKFNQEKDYIEISFVIYNENNYPIIFKRTFTDIKELEKFIKLLEDIKTIAQSQKYQVQLIPIGMPDCNSFNIYINGDEVSIESIKNYSILATNEIKSTLRDKIFFDINTITRETSYLFHEIHDTDMNFGKCIDLITAIKLNQNEKQQLKIIKDSTPIKANATIDIENQIFQIDLLKIIELIKKYFEINNHSIKETLEEQLLEECNKILKAIEKRYIIETNYFEITDQINFEDTYILLGFFEKLEKTIQDLNANTLTILEYKEKKFTKLQNLINSNINDINFIKSINVENQKSPEKYKIGIKAIVNPLPYASYSSGNFNLQMDKNNNVFKDIQKQQLEKLTQEERDSLIYYKSIFYRPINHIVALIRKKNITIEEAINQEETFNEIIKIISSYYNEYIERKKEIEHSPFAMLSRRNQNPESVKRIFSKFKENTPNEQEYINTVLLSIPNIENALRKIITTEDIIVYRGTTGINLYEDERFISTSLSLNIAKSFANSEERTNQNKEVYPNIIQIIIPKGSHIIAYTDDLFTDYFDPTSTFNEEQQEILIDPRNYEFTLDYINTNIIANGKMTIRTNYKAIPITKVLQIKYSK